MLLLSFEMTTFERNVDNMAKTTLYLIVEMQVDQIDGKNQRRPQE